LQPKTESRRAREILHIVVGLYHTCQNFLHDGDPSQFNFKDCTLYRLMGRGWDEVPDLGVVSDECGRNKQGISLHSSSGTALLSRIRLVQVRMGANAKKCQENAVGNDANQSGSPLSTGSVGNWE
jgi:hypothetical protein